MRRAFRSLCCGLLAGLAIVYGNARAADNAYPGNKPITIVVPFAAGGPTDTSARLLADALSREMGNPFVVENVPGAGSVVGTTRVANASPDGYTLLWGTASSLAIAPKLNKNIRYDPVASFAPISQVTAAPFVLVVAPKLEVGTLGDFVKLAKAQPGKLNFGSTGTGGSGHMVAELFNTSADIDTVHVPYNGGAPMMHALLAGDVDYIFDTPTTIVPMVQDKRVVALGVTSKEPWEALPGVEPLDRQGYAGFDATTWFGVLAPRGTPPERVALLNKHIVAVLDKPGLRQALQKAGFFVESSSPEAFAEKIVSEGEKWAQTIDAANISIE